MPHNAGTFRHRYHQQVALRSLAPLGTSSYGSRATGHISIPRCIPTHCRNTVDRLDNTVSSNLSTYVQQYAAGGRSALRAARDVRTKGDISEQQQFLRSVDLHDTTARERLVGIIRANKWSDVWASNRTYPIENSQKSLNWQCALFSTYAASLRAHVAARDRFYNALLTGDWHTANELMRQHEHEFGMSLWSLRGRLLLAEESGGKKTREQWVGFLQQEPDSELIVGFANIFSVAVDQSLQEEHVRAAIRSQLPESNHAFVRYFETLFIDEQTGPWSAWQMFEFAEHNPLVDRYELLLRLTSTALAQSHDDAAKLARACGRLVSLIPDPTLEYLHAVANTNGQVPASDCSNYMLRAWDEYVLSNYDSAYRACANVVASNPLLVGALELLTKCEMYLGSPEVSASSPLQVLKHHLRNVYSKSDVAEDSLQFLYRFATRFNVPSITGPLRAVYAFHSSANPDGKQLRRYSYTAGVHAPRNFEYGHPYSNISSYLAGLVRGAPKSTALKFFLAVCRNEPEDRYPAGIPKLRVLFFQGLYAFHRNDWSTAAERLGSFVTLYHEDTTQPLAPFAIEEARRVLVSLHLRSGNISGVLTTVVDSFSARPPSVRRMPLRDIYNLCDCNHAISDAHLEYPIVTSLVHTDPHKVCLALKRVLRHAGVTLPSQLRDQSKWQATTLALLYLRVCTADVLDSILGLDTDEKVEAERLLLLDWVTKHSTTFARAAESDILRLTQQAQLREALRKIEGTKVVINVPGLREAEKEPFSEAYHRFVARRQLALAKTTDDLLRGAIRMVNKVDGGAVLVIPKDAFFEKLEERQVAVVVPFASAFLEIRDTFISSPHFGLEACLSGRIRHGILIEHLHKPLVEHQLSYRPSAPDAPKVAEYWATILNLSERKDLLRKTLVVLSTLTSHIDGVASDVRENWVQTQTETKINSGLFNYIFTDDQLVSAFESVTEREASVATVDGFLDRVFDVLLARTRDNLSDVRRRINVELRTKLRSAMDEAIGGIAALDYADDLVSMRNALVLCKQKMEQACHEMLTWFQGSEAAFMVDADLNLVARTAVGMVERLNPDFRFRHEIATPSAARIRGRFFTALVHVVFFLLENAIKYSDITKEKFRSKVLLSVDDGLMQIAVENKMASRESAKEAQQRVESKIAEIQKHLDPHKVIREGGTGFAKILAAARYEFKQTDTSMKVDAVDDNVRVSVSFMTIDIIV